MQSRPLTVTDSLSHPPGPLLPSICTLTGTGGVHSTLRYLMSMRPFSIGAICIQQTLGTESTAVNILHMTLGTGSMLAVVQH